LGAGARAWAPSSAASCARKMIEGSLPVAFRPVAGRAACGGGGGGAAGCVGGASWGHVISLGYGDLTDREGCKQLLVRFATRALAGDQWFICMPTHEGANKRMKNSVVGLGDRAELGNRARTGSRRRDAAPARHVLLHHMRVEHAK
jgi:hypothetical protein